MKACGVVTGAAVKRNPFVGEISRRRSQMLEMPLVLRAVLDVPLAQFIHQVLQMGAQAFGAEALL